MSQKGNYSQKNNHQKQNKYDDWICLFCQNHNYSFRNICNRCHLQTKEKNAQMIQLYHLHLENTQETQKQHLLCYLSNDSSQSNFPNFVFLMINDEPWEEEGSKRQMVEPINTKWVNTIIGQ